MRRYFVLLILVCATAGLAWLFLRPAAVAVDLARVTRGELLLTVNDDGKTRIREKYVVSTPLSGRLIRIDLEPGDPVVAGTTQLAALQPTDPDLLDPRALAEARAREQAAAARLEQLEPRLQLARDRLNFAETEFGRVRQLEEKQAASEQQLDEARLAFDTARAEFTDALFAREIAAFELQQAQAALLHTSGDGTDRGASAAQRDPAAGTPEPGTPDPGAPPADHGPADRSTRSDDPPRETDAVPGASPSPWQFTIHSPITGQVLRVFQESSTIIAAGAPLLEIGDPADLEVEVDVLSTDAVRIRPGAAVALEQWGGDQPLTGRVRLVEPSAFTKISALGIEEQRVLVIIDFDEQSQPEQPTALGDGYRVEARIVIWEGRDVLKVPVGALFRTGADWTVFCHRAGRAQMVRVQLGHRNDQEAEVLAGLQEGDEVVLHPGDRIQDGRRIQPRSL